MTAKILTREEICQLRRVWDSETDYVGKETRIVAAYINTIDHLYAQRDALMRVKEAAEEKALLAIQRTAAIGLSLVLEEREACAKAALEYVPPRGRTMDLRDNQEICKRIMSRGEA